ncbi:MAG: DNA-processing protein DprA [Verrucomicrobia bacterium]|nr:DNA-processing protein DprA [Verrucomicrobiota bacterium]
MDARDFLTEDGRALLLLCSTLATDDTASPFTLTEWNQLARRIHDSPLQRPAALVGQSAHALAETLGVTRDDADRIVRLLERGGRVALELETLFSRGLWVVTRVDPHYPAKLRATLKHQSPTVLFGAGTLSLLKRAGIAVVGSRNIDEAGTAFAQTLGCKCAEASLPVVSGGARGTDSIAMTACLEAGGTAFGVLADSLERTIRQPDLRQLLLDERLVLLTPYAPTAGFSVGAAMGRNKVIYGLADYAVVVSSDLQKGGTWAGAVEALRAGWCPVFARDGHEVPAGNRKLLELHAAALPETELESLSDLPHWFQTHVASREEQPELLPMTVMERPAKYRAKR